MKYNLQKKKKKKKNEITNLFSANFVISLLRTRSTVWTLKSYKNGAYKFRFTGFVLHNQREQLEFKILNKNIYFGLTAHL